MLEYIVDSLYKEGIISEEDKEIVLFGFESMGANLIGIILVLIVGWGVGHVEEALFLWIFLFPLRKNAGGFHALTPIRCLFISAIMLTIAFIVFTVFNPTVFFYVICTVGYGCIIGALAPIDTLAKKLDKIECKVYRRRSRIILAIEGIIFILALWLKCLTVVRSVSMTFFIVGTSLIVELFRHKNE